MRRGGLWGVAFLMFGCGGDDPQTKATGDTCYIPSDCADPLVCAYQKCRTQCLRDKDCPSKHHCVGATQPRTGVCLPDENCTRNSDCHEPLICGRRSLCDKQCEKEVDCLASQTCDRGTCVDIEVAPADGAVLPPGAEHQTCLLNSDCEQGLVCLSGFCSKQCREARDCRTGEVCVSNMCVSPLAPPDAGADAPPGYGKPCAYPSECDAPLVCRSTGVCAYECVAIGDCKPGQVCNAAHNCIVPPADAGGDAVVDTAGPDAGKPCTSNFECDDGVFCNGTERCVSGRCTPPLEGPCDSKNACVKDACDEATKKCTHIVVTTIDADGDGHAALACGGDDCNDKDGTIYKGAPELCDLKDNDCNGVIDNDTVQPRGGVVDITFAAPERTQMLTTTLGGKFLVVTADATGVYARTLDVMGVAGTELTVLSGKTKVKLLGLATAGDVVAVIFDAGDSDVLSRRRLALIKSDLSTPKITVLSPSPGQNDSTTAGGAVAWNGTHFVAVWTYYVSVINGQYTLVDKDGTTSGGNRFLPTYGDAKLSSGVVHAAALGTTTAVAYRSGATTYVATFGPTGDKLDGPNTVVASGSVASALASNAKGFVLLMPVGGHYAYAISPTVVASPYVSIPFGNPLDVVGVGDGYAIAGRDYSDFSLRFGYSANGVAGPFEYNSPYPVTPAATDAITIAALPGTQIGFFYLAVKGDKKLHYQRIGCAP